jgi:hypothetical protein
MKVANAMTIIASIVTFDEGTYLVALGDFAGGLVGEVLVVEDRWLGCGWGGDESLNGVPMLAEGRGAAVRVRSPLGGDGGNVTLQLGEWVVWDVWEALTSLDKVDDAFERIRILQIGEKTVRGLEGTPVNEDVGGEVTLQLVCVFLEIAKLLHACNKVERAALL